VVSNKKKTNNKKRESKLCERTVSQNFVATWGFIDEGYGVFFALSGKGAIAVVRNKIKRVFRDMVRREILPLLKKSEEKDFSLCLISKKGIKFSEFNVSLRDELEKIVSKIVRKIG